MGRRAAVEDFVPVPTEAATQAVPTQEVCVPTQEIFANPRPRTLEDWVNVGQQVKRRRKSAVKTAVKGCSVAENVPEDVCPTQKLAEELCPTQQLPEEVEEPTPLQEPEDRFFPEKAQAYSRKSKRGRGSASADASASSGLQKALGKVASEVQPVPKARDARLSFQQMVSLGRRLRGKQPTIERHEAFACEAAGEASTEQGEVEAKLQPEAREEPLAVMPSIEEPPAPAAAGPELLKAKAAEPRAASPSPLSCSGPEDKKQSTAHSEHREPADCPEDASPLEASHVDLRGMVRKHIAEVQEALCKQQIPYQKVLDVYKALESSL
ncbi:unnamed protein product [Symbiodinium sp. CCMP2592]|nr:unnamed protein product [Symbiodinium sp. CCMP2592]